MGKLKDFYKLMWRDSYVRYENQLPKVHAILKAARVRIDNLKDEGITNFELNQICEQQKIVIKQLLEVLESMHDIKDL